MVWDHRTEHFSTPGETTALRSASATARNPLPKRHSPNATAQKACEPGLQAQAPWNLRYPASSGTLQAASYGLWSVSRV